MITDAVLKTDPTEVEGGMRLTFGLPPNMWADPILMFSYVYATLSVVIYVATLFCSSAFFPVFLLLCTITGIIFRVFCSYHMTISLGPIAWFFLQERGYSSFVQNDWRGSKYWPYGGGLLHISDHTRRSVLQCKQGSMFIINYRQNHEWSTRPKVVFLK